MPTKKAVISTEEILNAAGIEPVILGQFYRDQITGTEGYALSKTVFLHGCNRISIEPPGLKADGEPKESYYFDEKRLTPISNKKDPPIPYNEPTPMAELGMTYKDDVTGFEGVAISQTFFLYSQERVGIQPTTLHEGKPIEAQYFDAGQLKVTKAKSKAPTTKAEVPGGPGDCAKPPACARR